MGGLRAGAGQLRNCTVEGSKRLRVSDLTRGRRLAPGVRFRVETHWTDGYTGRVSGAVSVDVEIGPDGDGTMRLRYARPDAAGKLHQVGDQVVHLVATAQPFGGQRWRFLCPRTSASCEVLLCPPGASHFAGRKGWRLSYLSQRQGLRDRPLHRARKIRAAMGDTTGNLTLPFPDKPKWMRWARYEAQRAKAEAAHQAALRFSVAWLDSIQPGWRGAA